MEQMIDEMANKEDYSVNRASLFDLPIPPYPPNLESLKEGELVVHNGGVWLKGPTSGPYGFYNIFGFRFRIQFKKCRFRTFVLYMPIKARYCGFIKIKP